jgi:hypothetical protein
VFTSQEGSLGEVSEFFEVMAQVDRDLTTVDYFDRLLGLIKNLGRHRIHSIRRVHHRSSHEYLRVVTVREEGRAKPWSQPLID